MKSKLKLKLKGRIYLTVIPIIFIISLVLTSAFAYIFVGSTTNNIRRSIITNVDFYRYMIDDTYPGDYEDKNGGLYKSSVNLQGMSDIKNLKQYTGYDYTIFYQDERIATTIDGGEKLIGTKANASITERVLKQSKSIYGYLKINNQPYYTYYEPIKSSTGETIGMLFVGLNISTIIEECIGYSILVLIVLVVLAALALIAMAVVSGRISRRIISVSKHVELLRDKDFTQKVAEEVLNCYDETGDICRSVTQMQSDISTTLIEINKLADQVNEEAGLLSTSSEEMSKATESVTMTIQGVSQGAVDQAGDLVNINEVAQVLGDSVANVMESVSKIDTQSENINKVAAKSNQEMKQVIQILDAFAGNFKNYMMKMSNFEKHMNNIDEIIVAIESISKQTNLLALNAAIEAARAGEMGKGFSVVAEEIRQLAEQSQASTQNIASIIGDVSKETKELIDGTTHMNTELDTQAESLNQMVQSFEEIFKALQEILPQIKAVNKESVILEKQKNNILSRIENASSIAEEVSASCEEVYASTEEMNTSTIQVSDSADKLKQMTVHLKEQIELFKI